MTTFQTKKTNIQARFFRQLAFCMVFFALVIAYDLYISTGKWPHAGTYWLMGSITGLFLIIDIFKKRLFEISFDEGNKQIKFLYKSVYTKEYRRTIPYESTKIEVNEDTSMFTLFRKTLTIYFLKNKTEICGVNNTDDGFPLESLKQICTMLEEKGIERKNL